MTYPSELLTRSLILLSVKYLIRKPRVRIEIDKAKFISASNQDRTYYFWYGGLLFSILGASLCLLSIVGIALSLNLQWVSFGWIVFIFPGWFLIFISESFSKRARRSVIYKSDLLTYSKKDLLVSILGSVVVSSLIVSLLVFIPDYTF